MIIHIKIFTLLIVFFQNVMANWRLVDYSFSEKQISHNNWEMKKCCSSSSSNIIFDKNSCSSNQLEYVRLSKFKRYLQKSFAYKSFQVQIIFDAFFDGAISENSEIKVTYGSNRSSDNDRQLFLFDYDQNDLNQNSRLICHSSIERFKLETIVSNYVDSNSNNFSIKICFDPYDHRYDDECDNDHTFSDNYCDDDYIQIGIRNVLVYVNTCHPTCLTCDGPTESDCLTCFDNKAVQVGECECIPEQQFSETYIGCIQECSRDYSIARFDKICVKDTRIKSKFTLFQDNVIPQSDYRYSPLIFEKDEFYPKNKDLIQDNCNGLSFVGKLQFSEGMIYQMNLENAVKFLRIRITFYLFNFEETSSIQIIHNNQLQSRIIKDSSGFQVENLFKIFEKNQNCGSNYTVLRIEITFQLFNTNPTLFIQGQLQQESESWGFRNITVDTGFCQENCLVCSDFSTCEQCDSTNKLYKNKCIQSCPIHSSNCIDYEDIIPYSRYFARGFYDLNMTIDEIDEFYDSTTDPSHSLSTRQKFSFLNNKIVMGGLLVWNDGSYIKTWVIQKPHYAATIYFNLTYGDGYTGSFYYKIGASQSIGWQGPFYNPGGGTNLVGRTGLESTRYFNVSLTNFYTNNLYVEFKCDVITANITKEFCAISEYFIVIHYCPPLCSSCTSLTSCSDPGYTGPNCGSSQYLDFDQQTETYSCKNCNQPGCNTCTRAEQCTQCVNNQFNLSNGVCLCNPFTFLQGNTCVQCNKFCENCYGDSQYNCLTCVKDHHRSIQKNQCICLIGYYDDGNTLPCFPICGDQIIVGEEECDDGNNKDDDGCVDCQIKCQVQCTLCEKDICKECNVEGWQLNNQKCIPICGDQLILGLEECDDGNLIPYDGCYECKFSCPEQCAQCEYGICKACIKPGWVLNEYNICTTQCGDGIVVDPYEQCDDGNDYPYDGCYWCEFQCSEGCIECQQQQCKQCDYLYKLDTQTAKCLKEYQYDNDDNNLDIEISKLQLIEQINFRCGENQNLIDNLCVSQCGNGILVNQYEECDDGNNYGGDGCSAYCQIEDSYQCINQDGSLSLCTYIIAPEFNLNILSDNSQQIKTVELTFTQQVKLEESLNFDEIIVFSIFPQTRYQLTISCIQNLTITLNDPKYEIQIEFIEHVENPILQVDIQKNTIFNTYDLRLLKNNKTIILGTPFVLSQTTKQQLISIVQLNDVMMYSMAAVSSLAFLTGNAIMFFNLLDLLQSLSYVRYMQCQFPPHLNDFLNTYTKVSLQPIFDYLEVDQLIGISRSNHTINKQHKDPKYILQQPYLFNIKSCYFSVFASIITYIIYHLISSKSLQQLVFKSYLKYRYNYKIVKFINIFYSKVQKKCLKQQIEYFSLGIFKVYLAILHQFMFSALLAFPYYKFDSLFSIFNSINAIFGLIFIVISTLNLLSITSATIKNKTKWKYFFQEAKTQFWAIQIKSFSIYRILFYILIIVKLIDYPEAQSVLLSIQSLLYLVYLIKFKPLESYFELVKLICREFLLMNISGTFLVYSFEFSQENFILFGWIHISMFCTILASNLFIDLFSQIKITYDLYLQKKIKEKIEQERKYYFNHLQGFQINKNDYQQRK